MSASRSSAAAIAARYATAIFALASEAGKADEVVADLSTIAAAMQENAELRSALTSPLVGKAKKAAILAALAKKAGTVTQQALAIVAEQGRAAALPAIAEALRAKLAATKGELIAQVESARPLPNSVTKQLAESLGRATGKVVQLELKENPDLLGGVAVQIGSQRLDASLAAALNHMRRSLLGAAV